MVIKQHKLSFGKGRTFATIMYGACWHMGNPNSRADAIDIFMDHAKTKPWWHVGDMIEAIMPGDPRFSAGEHKEVVTHSITRATDAVRKARDTCLGLIIGNHEWKASAKMGDIMELIATGAQVPYLGGVAYFDFTCPNGICRTFTAHGRGGMGFNSGIPKRDQENREIKLRRDLSRFEADLKCVAHFHRTIVAAGEHVARGYVDNGVFKRDFLDDELPWCVACPSLFGNYDDGTSISYAEIMLMSPTDLGWMEIDIDRNGAVQCVREMGEEGDAQEEWRAVRVR